MATFQTTDKGIGYLKVTYAELMTYSQLPILVCDECNRGLLPKDEITIIPILNMAYGQECAAAKLQQVKDYPEDRQIRFKREEFWRNFYGIQAQEGDRA